MLVIMIHPGSHYSEKYLISYSRIRSNAARDFSVPNLMDASSGVHVIGLDCHWHNVRMRGNHHTKIRDFAGLRNGRCEHTTSHTLLCDEIACPLSACFMRVTARAQCASGSDSTGTGLPTSGKRLRDLLRPDNKLEYMAEL